MKINRPSVQKIHNLYMNNSASCFRETNNSVKSNKLNGAKADTVSISHEGSCHKYVDNVVKDMSAELTKPVDSKRIEELRNSINEGRYYISSEKLADAVLSRHKGNIE